MITIFQQIAQVLSTNGTVSAKLDALSVKVDALVADVAIIKAAPAGTTDLTALTQLVSDTQATVINIYAAIGNGGS